MDDERENYESAERARIDAAVERFKYRLAHPEEFPRDYTQPTPAERARKLAEQINRDLQIAIRETMFTRFTG